MLRKLIIVAVAAGILGLAAFWFLTMPQTVPASALGSHTPDLANGKTMFQIGGCASCHAVPKQEDRTRLGGGLALNSPFGTFYVPNISPDPKDGIGGWSEAQFVTALTKGTSPSGEHYYPAFPYTSYQRMTFDDLRDLFAYLKTLPPCRRLACAITICRFHSTSAARSAAGKLLFLDGAPFEPDPAQSAQWNRGAYLVNGPGHCAECHSPRNMLGGIELACDLPAARRPTGRAASPTSPSSSSRIGRWPTSPTCSTPA